MTVVALNRFPVKSCRGEPLQRATVEPWGLQGDRRWMIVDGNGKVVTAREVHALLRVHPKITADGLTFQAPDLPTLTVPTPDGSELIKVDVWGSQLLAAPAGAEASDWLTTVAGKTAQLVYLDDPTRRPTNPVRTSSEDRVSFADGYPVLLASEESLAELNNLIAQGPLAAEGPLPMMRFRPNVVVSGSPAWAEDDWRGIRIGAAHFRAVKGCDRCVLTTLDPETAAKGKEPIATLARHRRWDGKTWFGVNLVPDTRDVDINVGDPVEITSAVEPGNGPAR